MSSLSLRPHDDDAIVAAREASAKIVPHRKPKAARAAMEHNLEWFGKYVFGEKATMTERVAK